MQVKLVVDEADRSPELAVAGGASRQPEVLSEDEFAYLQSLPDRASAHARSDGLGSETCFFPECR